MALRLMVYIGLMYQDLVKSNQLSPEKKLPPVLPVVLYNGTDRWTAATNLAELILPPPDGLQHLQPSQRYLLIDERAAASLDDNRNPHPAATLYRLEYAQSPAEVRRWIDSVKTWLSLPEQASMRRSVAGWLLRLLQHKLSGTSIPELVDLTEIDTMLTRKSETWTERWERQGIEKGRKEGLETGLKKGRVEGERQLLRTQIERRFGRLPDWAETKFTGASEEQLLCWAEGLLDAPTLENLLAR